MPPKRPRLSPDDWLRAGFAALADTGPTALRAEPLARRLGTTKGSFYWHFKDVPDFRSQILQHWIAASHSAIAAARASDGPPTRKLQRLDEILRPEGEAEGGDVEGAMRAWARSDPDVSAAVARIDAARLAYVSDILAALGLTNPEFPRLVYGAYLGMSELAGGEGENTGALSTLTAALLALQDA